MGADTKNAAVDFIAGTVGDTVKTKLQTGGAQYTGALDAVRKTLADQGMRGLYRGMGAPLATVALFNAVLFSARGRAEAALAHADGSPLTAKDQALAGVAAGVAVSVLATPTELVKCRLQAQAGGAGAPRPLAAAAPQAVLAGVGGVGALRPAAAAAAAPAGAAVPAVRYRGPLDVVRHVMAAEGGVRGMFRGLSPTLAREVPGNAVMFSVYEVAKQRLAAAQGLASPAELGPGGLVIAGGLAGTAFWIPVFPADVVKSKWQTLRDSGVRGLYRGFGPAMVRAFPANAACFAAYEVAAKALRGF